MSRGFSGAMMKAFGAGEWVFTVTGVEDVTPHYRRITFHAPGFFDETGFGAASYVRFWMPDESDPDRQHQRAYTVVAAEETSETIVVEVVLHEPSGPAGAWAARAQVGDEVATTKWGSPRFLPPQPAPAGYLLVGDPAGIPAINAILAEIPDDVPATVLLEHTHDDDRDIPLTVHPRAAVTWVRRTGADTLLAESIPVADYSDWYVWVTAEAGATKEVRARLKEWGFPKSHIHAQGYWKQGRAMGTTRTPEHAEAVPDGASLPAAVPAGTWRTQAGSGLLAPLKRTFWIAGVAQAVASLLALTPFVLLAELARRFLAGSADAEGLWELGGWAVAVIVAGTVTMVALLAVLHLVDASFGHLVRARVIDRISRLPLGWFDQRSSGAVRSAVDDDAAALHYLVTHAVLDLVAAVVTPLAVLIYLFVIDPGLAVFLLLPLIVYYVLVMRMFSSSGWGAPVFESWKERISAESVAFLDGLAVTRTDDRGADGRLSRLLAERAGFINAWQRPLIGQKTTLESVTRPTTWLLMLTTIGGLFVIAGWTDPAELVPFLLLGVTFGAQLLAISYGTVAIRDARRAAQRIGLLLTEPELVPGDREAALGPGPHTVRFEGVGFAYRPGHRVLDGFDLTLQPGTMTALVGASGAGKSTVAALLARFHDVDQGRITIDGTDLRLLTSDCLYRTVGFALQGTTLVAGTLHENIALGRPDATRAEVEQAARAAQIHERIVRLAHGYDAEIGREARLSGGEAQRVAVARLILAAPPVLVLDEATSYADPESEHLIQQALAALVAERTVLVIAHRLHTVVGADQIVVLGAGGIHERGTHQELLAAGGAYTALWQAGAAERAVAEPTGRGVSR